METLYFLTCVDISTDTNIHFFLFSHCSALTGPLSPFSQASRLSFCLFVYPLAVTYHV